MLRSLLPPALVAVLSFVPALVAQRGPAGVTAPSPTREWDFDFAYAPESDLAEGSRDVGELSHRYTRFGWSRSFPLGANDTFTLGLGWQQFVFSDFSADIPDRLGALSLKLGYRRTLSAAWSIQAEFDPGLYGQVSDLDGDDFNVPFGIRALYAVSRDLQWGFALFVNTLRDNPVIGGVGVRWQFAPDWTLLFFLPEPRLEYALSPTLRLFAGGYLRGGTYRVADDFGRRRGRPILDGEHVDFRELGLDAGVRWELKPGLALGASVGWMLDRRFEYEARDLLINGEGAPVFRLSLNRRY